MMPAIVAASPSVRLVTSLPKYSRAASGTPWIANDPRLPRYTSFRYSSSTSSLVALIDRMTAMNCSSSLRRERPLPRLLLDGHFFGQEEIARELLRDGAARPPGTAGCRTCS